MNHLSIPTREHRENWNCRYCDGITVIIYNDVGMSKKEEHKKDCPQLALLRKRYPQ